MRLLKSFYKNCRRKGKQANMRNSATAAKNLESNIKIKLFFEWS